MDTLSDKELVDALISQHQLLREDIASISAHSVSLDPANVDLLYEDLSKFKKDLFQHLKFENEMFYVRYLAKQRAEGKDVEQLNNFIEQMDAIGEVVTQFLSKYTTEERISNGSNGEFRKQLHEVTDIFGVRMEAEEKGVYQEFLSMSSSSEFPTMTKMTSATEGG